MTAKWRHSSSDGPISLEHKLIDEGKYASLLAAEIAESPFLVGCWGQGIA